MHTLFSIANLLALPFWALMIFAPRWARTHALVRSPLIVVPPILVYGALVLPVIATILPLVARPELPAVAALLGTDRGATAAWAHFLAFDLFVGRWVYLDARERGLPARVVSPLLALTLLLGPLGLLGYLVVRSGAAQAVRAALRRLAPASPSLAGLALGSVALLVASVILMAVDPRQLAGASIWLKPFKFATSVAIVSATLALLVPHLRLPARTGRIAVALISYLTGLELVLITMQSVRGVGSHFNVATPFDTVVFAIMGTAIGVVTLAIGVLAIAAFRQRFEDRAFGWGIRLGLGVMLFGSAIAFIMPRPTPAQLQSLQAGRPTPTVGAHAVGVADGGAGLPVTKWSTEGGDLRVPHFVGIHALQLLPLAGWLLGRRRRGGFARDPRLAGRLTVIAGGAYFGLTVTTLVGALRGRPLFAPDAVTLALGAAVAIGAAIAAAASVRAARRASAPAAASGPGSAPAGRPFVDPGAHLLA